MRKRRIPQRGKVYWFAQQEELVLGLSRRNQTKLVSTPPRCRGLVYISRERRRRLDQPSNPGGKTKEKHVGGGD